MPFENVLTEQDGAVLVVTVNRPRVLNALDARTIDGRSVLFVTGVTFVNNQGVPALFAIDLEQEATRLGAAGDAWNGVGVASGSSASGRA